MFGALLSFLGGSAFRMVWGEISSFFSKRQDHKHEMARMELQAKLDAQTHERNLAAIKLQADLGVKTIQVQSDADVNRIEADAWLEAVKSTTRNSGIALIDGWNAAIRPAVATWAVLMLTLESFKIILLTEFVVNVCSAALGMYLADRALAKRGK